jgi:A nuclease of the HNH/ENDO VII superfamily with conserved LHH
MAVPPAAGRAPWGRRRKVELHHAGQVQDGLIKALTQTDHRIGENFKKNHPNTGKKASLIDRVLSRSFREGYWEQQSREGKFDHLPRLSETQIEELQRAAKARRKPRQRRSDE